MFQLEVSEKMEELAFKNKKSIIKRKKRVDPYEEFTADILAGKKLNPFQLMDIGDFLLSVESLSSSELTPDMRKFYSLLHKEEYRHIISSAINAKQNKLIELIEGSRSVESQCAGRPSEIPQRRV